MLLSHVSRSAEQVQICHKYHDLVRFKYILLCHNNDFNNFMATLLWSLTDKVPKAELYSICQAQQMAVSEYRNHVNQSVSV